MCNIKMSIDILNIINAVLDYRRFLASDNMVYKRENMDLDKMVEYYYNELPLPKELNHNKQDLERILSYTNQQEKLLRLNDTPYSDLHYDVF